jgi:signal transduction histidine kinase/ActR/RegA family two-component response regulator
MDTAREIGEPDAFMGRRAWVRYDLGMRIEVSLPDAGQHLDSATMHSVSGGGFAFWCRTQVPVGTKISVREWTAESSAEWMSAEVVHNSIGIKGYLVGATFNEPLPPDRDQTGAGANAISVIQDAPQHRTPARRSLRSRRHELWGLATLAGLGLTTTLAGISVQSDLWLALLLGFLSTSLIAMLGDRWVARRDARFQSRFLDEMKRMADGAYTDESLPHAPSHELVGLRQALLRLRANCRSRDDLQRAKREKLEELNLIKGNILNIVSHDLRTPLTSILLYAQMLRETDDLTDEERARFLDIIVQECTRLSRLVDDLLEAQRLQSGRTRWQIEQLDMSTTIRDCFRVFEVIAQSRDIDLRLDCPQSLPPIEADGDKMSQVVSNLLSNAVKYVGEGGHVRVSVRERGNDIVICVEDNGPGIPRDQWDQIFDRFAQLSATKYVRELPGVGLGLYIVRQIVERHGGRVWVDSEVGRGSSFFVSLPAHVPDENAAAPDARDKLVRRVLVCDADPELAARIASTLQRMNYEVRVVHSGCRLLSLIEQMDFDVVLTDILLPDIDAADLIRSLTAREERSYRLVVHSYAGDGDELRRQGADVFLQRPATTEELSEGVRIAMQRRERGATVLLLNCAGVDVGHLRRAIAEAGGLPLTADSIRTGVELLRKYPIDCVVLPEAALDADWSQLSQFQRFCDARLVVACAHVRRRERRLGEQREVTVVEQRPGMAKELVSMISGDEMIHSMEAVG